MNLAKLCLALIVGGGLTLQAACGSSGPTGTTGGSAGQGSSSGGSVAGTGTGAAATGTGTGTGAAATGTGTGTGAAATGTGSASGGTSTGGTTGGAPTTCNVDTDCPCGDVCSWAQNTHVCVLASSGDPGWCDSTPNCLYVGQTCSGTSCTPAWTPQSVCNEN
jgi:hypothetical protein